MSFGARHSKFVQQRDRHVTQPRMLEFTFSIAQKSSRNQLGSDAVIAAPLVFIILNHGDGNLSQRRFPRGSIAFLPADNQVWRQLDRRPVVDLIAEIDLVDGGASPFSGSFSASSRAAIFAATWSRIAGGTIPFFSRPATLM